MYKFKLPIGDWSGDGHSICEWFIIESSHPVEEVREMYFKACEKAGFKFDEVYCSKYEQYYFTVDDLEEYPLPMFDVDYYKEDDGKFYLSVEEFAELFLDWIQYYNSEFDYTIVDDDLPMLPFYGFDDKKRHIGFIGYGLFE